MTVPNFKHNPLILILLVGFTTILSCDKDDSPDNFILGDQLFFTPEIILNDVDELLPFSYTVSYSSNNQEQADVFETGILVSSTPDVSFENYEDQIVLSYNLSGSYTWTKTDLPNDPEVYYLVAYATNPVLTAYSNEIIISTSGNKTLYDSVEINSQEELNHLGFAGYNTIAGSLKLSGNITDLSPLQDLYILGNTLEIDNTNLSNLEGLSNLTEIGYEFVLTNNSNLSNMSGLTSVVTIIGDVKIERNDALTNLIGFPDIERISGRLDISYNQNLQSLEGLNTIETIEEVLSLNLNPSLSTLVGLDNLNNIESLVINENNSLNNISGIENLDQLEYLYINRNQNLTDISAIIGLNRITSLAIHANPQLNTLPSFTGTLEMEYLEIAYENGFQSLHGLESIVNVFEISLFQTNLMTLDGLDNLNTITNLYINQNQFLSDYCALTNLLSNGNGPQSYSFFQNAFDPTIEDLLNGNCNN
ncbi:hypothetical protein [Winogradskyella aurantiaca]|uniref:hypothetical protein n=1 Tax=Winogradskyella aurantiaca TaxID=2219558 RepID=UPI000E1D3541|nr:hypothetical protein [Winogradskyella aurantiaca]